MPGLCSMERTCLKLKLIKGKAEARDGEIDYKQKEKRIEDCRNRRL